ncbi:AgmX/PglI C-terminal domain-containing protein [Colwellia sp. RE-S-Sl-9]
MLNVTLSYNDSSNAVFSDNAELFTDNKQDTLFTKVLIVLLSLYLIFGIIVPFMDRIEVQREIKEQVPVQLTRVLLEMKEKEITPPVAIEEKEPEPEVEKEEVPVEKAKTQREVAKEKAKTTGLAAMKDDLFSLRDAFVVAPKSSVLVKSKSTEAEKVKRKLLAAKANEQSKNIASAQVTKTVASDALSPRNTQTVHLAEEEILADTIESEEESSENLASIRSEMKLRQTLEANKSRLYSLYNRALRKNPFLKGKVLFEIEIQANGTVSKVVIQSSELEDKALERRLMSILKSIDFGEEDVNVMSTIWAIEFLPR